jgi:gas vesicle protein
MFHRSQSTEHWTYFFLGAVFGAAALLFVSPKARESIVRTAGEGKERVDEEVKKGQRRFQEGKEAFQREARGLVEKARDFTKREKEIILAAIEAGRRTYKEERETRKTDFEI